MIHSGLVSITFRQRTPEEIVSLVARAGLEGIEWGGDVHVPHGDLVRASAVRRMTADAGLAVAAYGSYYRVGVSEAEGLRFEAVLETTVALGAPLIRVWAGNRGSAAADAAWWAQVVGDAQRIASLAEAAGIAVAFEYHRNTLTDTNESAVRLLAEVAHPNVHAYWQPPVGATTASCLEGLNGVSYCLAHLHVFHWLARGEAVERRPLAEGAQAWAQYLAAARATGRDHFALIEFVRNDAPEQFLADAQALKGWLSSVRASDGPA